LLVFNWRHLDRLQPPASEQAPRGISAPSRVILGFCIIAALSLVSPIGWFLLVYAGYFALVFSLLFAYAVLWALIDLVRFARMRTPTNIGIAVLGVAAVVIAVWGSYQSSTATGPVP
jgi:heme/copper-type cytochrome/quinol oxidase subunit 4